MRCLVLASAILFGILSILSAPALAAFLSDVGDLRARHNAQILSDRGCSPDIANTWPMSNSYFTSSPSNVTCAQAPQAPRLFNSDSRALLTVAGGNAEPVFRGYGDQPRERGEVTLAVTGGGDRFGWHLEASAIDARRDDDHARLDGSWVAVRAGGWLWGAGAIDRWWGPGWYSSTVLSSNARPVPSLWLTRDAAVASELPVVRWLGPWDLTLFGGALEAHRAVPNAKLLGARFSFKPWSNLEVGLSRLAQWGGEGRPETFGSLWNLIIGKDNGETSGFADGEDPGNQLGSADVRLGIPLEESTVGVYFQLTGDDEAGGLPSKYAGLAGVDWATQFGAGQQRWILEASNTIAGGWIGDDRLLTTYEHSTYKTGLRYEGRNIASTWERDADVVTLGAMFFLPRYEISVNYSEAELNKADRMRPAAATSGAPLVMSSNRQKLGVWGASISMPIQRHLIAIQAQYLDEPVPLVSGGFEQTTVTASWTYAFGG